MNPELVKELFQKYLNGACTPAEIDFLEKTFLLYLQTQDTMPDEIQIRAASERVRNRLAGNIRRDQRRKWKRVRFYYAVAALLIASFSIGFITWRFAESYDSQRDNWAATDAQPGGNKAILTLADGEMINLNEAQQGIIVGDGITYADGTPVLDNQRKEGKNPGAIYLTLRTPKGGMYQVTLPDGTHVWLNASSVLKYPNRFAADERIVEIEGEGYFAVAKDKKRPFKVSTSKQELMVLGTAFNISAYPDENQTETTLVEGAVKIINVANKAASKLHPGQQALLSSEGLQVRRVDTKEFTAWKDGYFFFNDANIYTILKKFSRWYDVEIDDSVKPTNDLFTGKIPRNVSLKSALRIVEGTSGMSFQLIDKKLVLVK